VHSIKYLAATSQNKGPNDQPISLASCSQVTLIYLRDQVSHTYKTAGGMKPHMWKFTPIVVLP